jgi:ornithine cyclodeaminase/alanine dehydrogenase-like protein (mu-crystallin family)
MRIIDSTALQRLIPQQDAIEAVPEAFVASALGEFDQPQRIALADGSALAMMARYESNQGTAIKVVSGHRQRSRRARPTSSR